MTFNPEVSLSGLITIVLFIFGAAGAWFGLKQLVAVMVQRIAIIERDMGTINSNIQSVENDVKGIAAILTVQAVQTRTLEFLQTQINEMKHGEGFIFPLGRGAHEVPPKR